MSYQKTGYKLWSKEFNPIIIEEVKNNYGKKCLFMCNECGQHKWMGFSHLKHGRGKFCSNRCKVKSIKKYFKQLRVLGLVKIKRCSRCSKTKLIKEFHKRRTIGDGYAYICKQCKAKMDKAYCNLHNHINRGKIIKPKFCTVCKSKDNILGHHEDYSKKMDVLWLCSKCHYRRHHGA